jgi:hypothetical protein
MKILTVAIACVLAFCFVSDLALAKKKEATSSGKRKYVKSKYGIKALLTLSRDRGAMVKEYEKETKNYRKVKKAIDHGQLKKEESASKIKKMYGDPVVVLTDKEGKIFKWVYKPGNVSFLDNKKVYLIFNQNEKLVDWKLLGGN